MKVIAKLSYIEIKLLEDIEYATSIWGHYSITASSFELYCKDLVKKGVIKEIQPNNIDYKMLILNK